MRGTFKPLMSKTKEGMKMKIYFEYRNQYTGITGWSDNFTVESLEEAGRRAGNVIARIPEIFTVIAHDATNDKELCRWGM